MTTAEDVVREAARLTGLDVDGAELLRAGSNTLLRLRGGLVARVGPTAATEVARREVDVARWLAGQGIVVVRPVDGVEQPTVVDDRAVTWWQEVPAHRAATPAELGAVLRRLHGVTRPARPTLPRLDPFAGFPARAADAPGLTSSDRHWLDRRLERLRVDWERLPEGLPTGVIHGDAWQGNVAVTADGICVLLDLEHVAIGRPEWDLVHLAADHVDFARIGDADYGRFVEAYGGYDVTGWPGFRVMADVVELRWVCFALGRSADNPVAADEARHRVACLRGDVPRPWTWHAL